MEMQDNEFDDLFRSKLDGFEMEPSANVWQGVNDELQSRKRKGVLLPLLSIAASIIVLVTAGILFIPQKGGVIIKHTASTVVTKTYPATNPVAQASNNPVTNTISETHVENKASKPVNRIASNNKPETVKINPAENTDVTEKRDSPVKVTEQPVIALLASKPDGKDVVVPGTETKLVPQQPVTETTGFITKPVLVADQLPVQNKPEVVPELKPKHKIHTLGDLLNVVVAKVDKRKDKVIEFASKDDEDDAAVTGLNLGIVKFKKEK
jgi:hypothetical protein